jgi:PRC-barrel domain protein
MSKRVEHESAESLRYLDGTAVECAGGKLNGLSVFSQDDEALGVIDGVLIDPGTRRLRYYVVQAARMFNRRRYLVSADSPAIMMPDDRALRVEARSESIPRERFDSRSVPRFSDDDLLTAMFSSPA